MVNVETFINVNEHVNDKYIITQTVDKYPYLTGGQKPTSLDQTVGHAAGTNVGQRPELGT